jgi:amino acid transporter
MQYWNTSVNPAVWVAMALIVCTILNLVSVRWYGDQYCMIVATAEYSVQTSITPP